MLVDFPADEVALRIKVIVDLAVDGDEFLECLRPAEFEHRRLSSSKRLMRILGPIVLPLAHFPALKVSDVELHLIVRLRPFRSNTVFKDETRAPRISI